MKSNDKGAKAPTPKKVFMAANHLKNCAGGRKKRGYYLTDEENEFVKKAISDYRAA